jgi:hypothetical protein
MQSCAQCGSKSFGLIQYQLLTLRDHIRFCSKHCKDDYRKQGQQEIRKRQFYRWLHVERSTPSPRLPIAYGGKEATGPFVTPVPERASIFHNGLAAAGPWNKIQRSLVSCVEGKPARSTEQEIGLCSSIRRSLSRLS